MVGMVWQGGERQCEERGDDHLRDEEGEQPLDTAKRELAEEIAKQAESWELVMSFLTSPGFSDERVHLYLATGLTFGEPRADGVEEQSMTVERLALTEVVAAINDAHRKADEEMAQKMGGMLPPGMKLPGM